MDFSKYLTIQIHSELVRFMVAVFPVLLYTYIVLPLQLFSTMIGLLSHSVSATCFDPSPLPLVSLTTVKITNNQSTELHK